MPTTDADAAGQQFVQRMMALLAAVVVLYVVLHLVLRDRPPTNAPHCTNELPPACFGYVDPHGRVVLINPGDVEWFVGAATAALVRDTADANSREMAVRRESIQRTVGTRIAPLLIDRSPADQLSREVERGDVAASSASFDALVASLSTLTANSEAVAITEIRSDLSKLHELEASQHALVASLTPPLARLFFWTSPEFSMLEVLFWALFGVLTNLLVNATEYLRKGAFHPPERWVSYTKLMYGPIFALILVFAMINGFFRPESYEVRVWTLPLVSFLFGYASRRTARLIDDLLERFLGASEQAVRAGPQPVTEARRALVEKLMSAYRPNDLHELRAQAKALSHELVADEASAREGR